MMRRFARWLLVLALSLSIGLQWAVVQGAAWVGMIVSYSQEVTIAQSLAMTFDGRHPCKLCKAAQRGDSTQKKQNADNPPGKFVLAAPETEPFLFSCGISNCESERVCASVRRSHRPPSPPPKAV